VIIRPSRPFTSTAYFKATRSSHPHLLGLPVVAPYSPPFSLSFSPISSFSSVGKGPSPTLVVYAFDTAQKWASEKYFGGRPVPLERPKAEALEEVT